MKALTSGMVTEIPKLFNTGQGRAGSADVMGYSRLMRDEAEGGPRAGSKSGGQREEGHP